MDYKCPRCRESLRRQGITTRLLPGERTVVPMRVGYACRFCDATLRMNPHPLEMKLMSVALVATCSLFVVSRHLESKLLFMAATALMLAFSTALIVLSRTRFREWPRYTLDGDHPQR